MPRNRVFPQEWVIRIGGELAEAVKRLRVQQQLHCSDEQFCVVPAVIQSFETCDFLLDLFGVIAGLRHMNPREIHLVEHRPEYRKDAQVTRHRSGQIDRLKFQRLVYSCLCHWFPYPLGRCAFTRASYLFYRASRDASSQLFNKSYTFA